MTEPSMISQLAGIGLLFGVVGLLLLAQARHERKNRELEAQKRAEMDMLAWEIEEYVDYRFRLYQEHQEALRKEYRKTQMKNFSTPGIEEAWPW
nr:MAG TPA: hypothetical protein [Caudoviricetes sp.]